MTQLRKSAIKRVLLLATIIGSVGMILRTCGTITVRGPYLQLVTPTNIVVRWRTSYPVNSMVSYGREWWNLENKVCVGRSSTEHEVVLHDLSPATKYYYSIGCSLSGVPLRFRGGSGEFDCHFYTAPLSSAPQPVRIWVTGDSGTADANARAVRDAFLTFNEGEHVDVWLMLGDNAYDSGTDWEHQRAIFNTYPTLLPNTVLWPTVGNHDAKSLCFPSFDKTRAAPNSARRPAGNPRKRVDSNGKSLDELEPTGPYFDIFTLPKNAQAGGAPSGTESWYSFDYANVHFISLNSSQPNRSNGSPMISWLADDLRACTQQWIIAFWDHAPYSSGRHNSDADVEAAEMRVNVLPLLETYGADLVLAGHTHAYARSSLINAHFGPSISLKKAHILEASSVTYTKPAHRGPHQGTVYVLAGSSGRIEDKKADHPVFAVTLNVLGSVLIEVNGSTLHSAFVDTNATIRDSFNIKK